MILMSYGTTETIKALFIKVCEKLATQDTEKEKHYKDLIFECENCEFFNFFANLCNLLKNNSDILADELVEFLRILGGA